MRKYRRIFSFIACLMLGGLPLEAGNSPKSVGKPVAWTTPDGVRLVGRYQPRKEPGRLVWILLHGLGSTKEEWQGFVGQLVKQGEGFLIYDLRGHGESNRLAAGGTLDYRKDRTAGPGTLWDHMAADLESAVSFLKSHATLNAHGVAVGGASLGANIALVYASQHKEVPAVALLSPGLVYAGIESEAPFRRYGTRPVFIAASPGDAYAYTSVRQLIAPRTDPNCLFVSGEGATHGVTMFNPSFTPRLLAWMKKVR